MVSKLMGALAITAVAACAAPVETPRQGTSSALSSNNTLPADGYQSFNFLATHLITTPDPSNPNVPLTVSLSPLLNPARCLDVPGAASSNGIPVQLWDCNGFATAQGWHWVNGQLRIQGGVKCLVADNNDVLQAKAAVLTNCSAATSAPQGGLWNYQNGLLEVGATNRCLALGDTAAARGVPVTLTSCSANDPRQLWGVDTNNGKYLRGSVVTTALNSSKCLDVLAANPNNGTQVEIYDCSAGSAQQWVLEGLAIRALQKCLTVSTSDSSVVEIDTCTGVANQQWVFTNGEINLAGTDSCLSLPNSTVANLTRVQVTLCTGGNNQQWSWGG